MSKKTLKALILGLSISGFVHADGGSLDGYGALDSTDIGLSGSVEKVIEDADSETSVSRTTEHRTNAEVTSCTFNKFGLNVSAGVTGKLIQSGFNIPEVKVTSNAAVDSQGLPVNGFGAGVEIVQRKNNYQAAAELLGSKEVRDLIELSLEQARLSAAEHNEALQVYNNWYATEWRNNMAFAYQLHKEAMTEVMRNLISKKQLDSILDSSKEQKLIKEMYEKMDVDNLSGDDLEKVIGAMSLPKKRDMETYIAYLNTIKSFAESKPEVPFGFQPAPPVIADVTIIPKVMNTIFDSAFKTDAKTEFDHFARSSVERATRDCTQTQSKNADITRTSVYSGKKGEDADSATDLIELNQ